MEQISDIGKLNDLFSKYFIKGTVTNNYVLSDSYKEYIKNDMLHCILKEHNSYILVKFPDYYQLYYFINDLQELVILDADIPVVIEILYRGEINRPRELIDYWKACNFRLHLTRDNMIAEGGQTFPDNSADQTIKVKYAENEQEVRFCKNLIDSTFDIYTGDRLTMKELKRFADNRNILCSYFSGDLCGILRFEIRNNNVWLGHIAVDPEYRGKGVAFALITKYILENSGGKNARFQLWVMQDNSSAISLYKKFGFKYGNKSSVSLLKN